MAEDLNISKGSKQEKYRSLLPQIEALICDEPDLVANLANVAAALKEQFNFFWVGFYLVKNGELVLGPFQGPVACTRISKGRGVCGQSFEKQQTIVVPDVDMYPDHIACSSQSKSEIVVPIIQNDVCVGVLDVDSSELATFDEVDQQYLEQIANLLDKKFN